MAHGGKFMGGYLHGQPVFNHVSSRVEDGAQAIAALLPTSAWQPQTGEAAIKFLVTDVARIVGRVLELR